MLNCTLGNKRTVPYGALGNKRTKPLGVLGNKTSDYHHSHIAGSPNLNHVDNSDELIYSNTQEQQSQPKKGSLLKH